MKVDFEAVQATFLQVLEKPEEARDSFIAEACGDNLELRNQIQILLKAHFDGTGLLDHGLINDPSWGAKAGDRIGPYKLREKIGEGGFGVVYVAEQKNPVTRKVALKVIKPGMDSKDIIARFEAERQALAMMDHPNVAKVLDAGATESGRPYFVMELVHGESITDYCDTQKLTNRQRLELFIDVCHAVQHAHQKGLIHRDIKPSNVMVTMADHRPVVKVIDFGVAKALHHDLTDKSIYTGYGQMIGTPMYMSPEQAQMSSLDVDTRSDIYSLGVLLYELLTGTTPFDKEIFKKAGFDEVRRMIREVEPPRPSDQVSTLKAQQISTISDFRNIDPRSLSRSLRGDLDWIVMKALEKDRARRYSAANLFAGDIRAFLDDMPIAARPPSRYYRIQKFIRRNKLGSSVVLATACLLLAGVSSTAINNRVLREKDKEIQSALDEASANLALATHANERAQARLKELTQSNQVLTSIFQDLNIEVSRHGPGGLESVLAERLVGVANQLAGLADEHPDAQAEMQQRLGNALASLGYPAEAMSLYRSSYATRRKLFGDSHESSLRSACGLVQCLIATSKYSDAIAFCRNTIRDAGSQVRASTEAFLELKNGLAVALGENGQVDESLDLLTAIHQESKANLGEQAHFTLTALNNLATAKKVAGQSDEAILLFEQAVKARAESLGPGHPSTLASKIGLGSSYRIGGQLIKATEILQSATEALEIELGLKHPMTLGAINNLGRALQDSGRHQEAILKLAKATEAAEVHPGMDHPTTQICMNNLANSYLATNQLERAIELLEKCVSLRTATLKEHPVTLTMVANLARAYVKDGQPGKGAKMLERTLDSRSRILPPDDPTIATNLAQLASAYRASGQLVLALEANEKAIGIMEEHLPSDHHFLLTTKGNLASTYWSLRRINEAIGLYEEVLDKRVTSLGREHPTTKATIANLAVNYKDAGRFEEAIPLLEEIVPPDLYSPLGFSVVALVECYVKGGDADAASALVNDFLAVEHPAKFDGLAAKRMRQFCDVFFLPLNKLDDAVPLLRQAILIQEAAMKKSKELYLTRISLGETLAGLGRFEEAEQQLRAGFEGLEASDIAPLLPVDLKRQGEAISIATQALEEWMGVEPHQKVRQLKTSWADRGREFDKKLQTSKPKGR